MKALFYSNQLLLRKEVPLPELKTDEVLVRVLYAGICNTDLEIVKGYMGFTGIPGHEFVGSVVAPGDSQWIGKRVVGEINCGCGTCSRCLSGDQRHCSERSVLGIQNRNGAFAEYLAVPSDRLHKVPDRISTIQAVFTEPCAAACRISEQVPHLPERVLVIGDGKLGLLIAEVLSFHTNVTLLGHHRERTQKICGTSVKVPDRIPEHRRFPLVVEASGSSDGLGTAFRIVEPEGTVIVKSTYHGHSDLNLSLSVVVPEVKIIGSRCGPFEAALKVLSEGRLNVEDMVEAEYGFAQWDEAFERAARPGALKVLIRMGGGKL